MSTDIRLYQPSSGTAGHCFISTWCGHCKHDRVMNGEVDAEDAGDDDHCQILGATFCHDLSDPKYPREWRYNEAGEPVCTAFEPSDATDGPSCAVRDPYTTDMFEVRL